MSEEMVLKIQERSDFGTRSSKRMRKAGQVPAVLSHKSDNPIHISISDHDFQMILNKGGRIINLEGAGNAFIKDVQWDHLGDKILHVDFTKVAKDEKLTMDVAIVLKGIPAGVREDGGTLDQFVQTLKIECLPTSIPESIEIDVTGVKINAPLHLGDVPAIPGVTFLQEKELVLATVTEHRAEEIVEEEVSGSAEPEVIVKEKKEDSEDKK